MKKQKTNFIKEMAVFLMVSGFLSGCGVTSNSSSTGKGGGDAASIATQSISPGESARIQNQAAPDASAENEYGEDQIMPLYDGLSSKNPTVRKNSEKTLRNLIDYNDQFLEELKKLEGENKNPNSWYAASQIIKDAEKAKSQAEAEEIKRQIAESQAADSASN